jgi:hypothetical protein
LFLPDGTLLKNRLAAISQSTVDPALAKNGSKAIGSIQEI